MDAELLTGVLLGDRTKYNRWAMKKSSSNINYTFQNTIWTQEQENVINFTKWPGTGHEPS